MKQMTTSICSKNWTTEKGELGILKLPQQEAQLASIHYYFIIFKSISFSYFKKTSHFCHLKCALNLLGFFFSEAIPEFLW